MNNIDNKEKEKRSPLRLNFFAVLLIVLFFYSGVAWGKKEDKITNQQSVVTNFWHSFSNPGDIFKNREKDKPPKVDFSLFWESWKRVDNQFVNRDKIDYQKMVYGAINGMIHSLGDPYSSFMSPEETKEFNTEMEGSFEGIGAELGMKDDILTVIAPIKGMPAEKAGLRAGDKILKINNEITSDISIDEAVKKIRGKKGTEVTLTILRKGNSHTKEIKITRGKIEIKSVVYEKKEGGIAYLRINKFAEDTALEFDRLSSQMIADNTKGIVLDLRNNPGGFLTKAVEITSKFVKRGEPIVYEENREGKRKPYKAQGGEIFIQIPVVVIINEGSASASEIMAGALRDLRKAVLIGKKSFGKGSVQQLEPLSGGSSIKITIAKWLTPSGHSIHEVGLSPDKEVDFTEKDFLNKEDPQLKEAMKEIKNEILQKNK